MERHRSLPNPLHHDRHGSARQLRQHRPLPATCHTIHLEEGSNHRYPLDTFSALFAGPRSVRAADTQPSRLESKLHHPSAISTIIRLFLRQFSEWPRLVVHRSSKYLCELRLLTSLDIQKRSGLFWNPCASYRHGLGLFPITRCQSTIPQITQPVITNPRH